MKCLNCKKEIFSSEICNYCGMSQIIYLKNNISSMSFSKILNYALFSEPDISFSSFINKLSDLLVDYQNQFRIINSVITYDIFYAIKEAESVDIVIDIYNSIVKQHSSILKLDILEETLNNYIRCYFEDFSYKINSDYLSQRDSKMNIVVSCKPDSTQEIFDFDIETGSIKGFKYKNTQMFNLIIPSDIGGVKVISVGENAFSECNLERVEINYGIEIIEDYAFSFNQINELILPSSLISIGVEAFIENKLTLLELPDSITCIGQGAFEDNVLSSVSMPSRITTIEDRTFLNNRLTSIILPTSVNTIGHVAFMRNCLTSVSLPTSVNTIGPAAFCDNKITNFTIPISLTSIGVDAFSGNSIKELRIPKSVRFLGYNAFEWGKISDFRFETENPYYKYLDDILFNHDCTKVIAYFGNKTFIKLPEGIEEIGWGAFSFRNIKTIAFPKSLVYIGGRSFEGNKISDLVIGENVTFIDDDAFKNNQIENITIPSSVKTIFTDAFTFNLISSVLILGDKFRFNDVWDDIGFPEHLKPQ